MVHGSPSPRKTLTELDPVMFPTAESANSELQAAVFDAKVSGKEVPKATKVIAVTESLMPNTHPNKVANSPTTPVTIPMNIKLTTKASHPRMILLGGINANMTFQPMVMKCITASQQPMSSTMLSSSMVGPSITAFLNCWPQVASFCWSRYSNIFCQTSSSAFIPLSSGTISIKQMFFFEILVPLGQGLSSLTQKINTCSAGSSSSSLFIWSSTMSFSDF